MDKKQALESLISVSKQLKDFKDSFIKLDNSNENEYSYKFINSAREIFVLLLTEKNINQRTLATKIGISAQGVSDIVKKLESKQLVTRTQSDQYNQNLVSLTPKGEQFALTNQKVFDNISSTLFNNFTCDELQSFTILLNKLQSNIIKNKENL